MKGYNFTPAQEPNEERLLEIYYQGLKQDSVSTRKKKEQVLKNLVYYKSIVTTACIATGISRKLYYRWIKEDPGFREAVQDIEEASLDFVEEKLLKEIKRDNLSAIIFYLKSKGKKRGYGDSPVNISAQTPGEIQITIVKHPEDLENRP